MRTVFQLNIFRVLSDGDVALATEVWTFMFADGTSEDRSVVVK